MANKSKSFWSRVKESIRSDYMGKPLDEEPGLIEIISEEVLSKFIKEQKTKISKNIELNDFQDEKIEIHSRRDELLQQIQSAVRSELDKGKTTRIIMNIIVWIITLISGGLIGVLFQKYITL